MPTSENGSDTRSKQLSYGASGLLSSQLQTVIYSESVGLFLYEIEKRSEDIQKDLKKF